MSKEDCMQEIDESSKKRAVAIEHFYKQMNLVPCLAKSEVKEEKGASFRLQEMQDTALTIIHQFKEDQQHRIKEFDTLLLPLAKEVLEEMTEHAEELGENLKTALHHLNAGSSMDWQQQAKQWASLYAKWYDPKHFVQKVLYLASQKATRLIEKDMKVICDYQTQSLVHLSPEEYQHVQARLKAATAEPLKALQELKQSPTDLSLKQASEWMAHLYHEREIHFDELLKRVDQIIKEVVQPESIDFGTEDYLELENELKFTEHELIYLRNMWHDLEIKEASNKEFLNMRLNELEEHLQQFDFFYVPSELKERMEKVSQHIRQMRQE